MNSYYRKLLSLLLIVGGVALLLEHLFVWGGFDLPVFSHDFYGLMMIMVAYSISLRKKEDEK